MKSSARLFIVVIALLLSFRGPANAAQPSSNEFFAMDTIANGEPAAVARMLKDLGYDGIGGGLDEATPAAIASVGLKLYTAYHVITLVAGQEVVSVPIKRWLEARHFAGSALWLAIERVSTGETSNRAATYPANEAVVITQIRELAAQAGAAGKSISLYPHTGYWLEHFDDAVQLVEKIDRPNVSVTFNLCHWLKTEGSTRDPLPLLRAALPHLAFVTINGSDSGNTQKMDWDQLIQPLGAGSYDVATFVRRLRGAGYHGPFGFQGYGIKGDAHSVLARTMSAWRRISALSPASNEQVFRAYCLPSQSGSHGLANSAVSIALSAH
ncbi:MAG: TIM barrel protein [Opitutus sp.]